MTIRNCDSVQKLCSLAVTHKLVSAIDMSIAYQTYLMTKIQAGQCQYILKAQAGRLLLQERERQGEEWSSLDMPAPAYSGDWVPFSSEKLALFDPSGKYQGVHDRSHPEVIPTQDGGFLWSSNRAYRLSGLYNPLVPVHTAARGPYDFYLPPGQQDGVFLTDRAAGLLIMTDMTLNVTKLRIKLREAGSSKALCMAYDSANRTAFLTDHQTSDLIVVKPFEQKMQRISTPHGVLGNLVLDAPRNRLFVILADPDREPAILIFSTQDYSHQGTLLLPGKRFSALDDPCDLMGLSPDGKSLLVMSYTDEPALCTPLISQIDIASQKLLTTHTLSTEEKPIGIVFQHQPPARQDVPDFDDFLVEKGIAARPQIIGLVRQIQALEADKNKPILDGDVEAAMAHIQDNFSAEEVKTVAEISQQAVQALSQENFFEWQGRSDMNGEEKQVFVERLSELKADPKVSQTNGVFVLNWLKGLAH